MPLDQSMAVVTTYAAKHGVPEASGFTTTVAKLLFLAVHSAKIYFTCFNPVTSQLHLIIIST
ncbi:hypothetical protein ACEQPO_04815 [Bacillus sp. SL00103]